MRKITILCSLIIGAHVMVHASAPAPVLAAPGGPLIQVVQQEGIEEIICGQILDFDQLDNQFETERKKAQGAGKETYNYHIKNYLQEQLEIRTGEVMLKSTKSEDLFPDLKLSRYVFMHYADLAKQHRCNMHHVRLLNLPMMELHLIAEGLCSPNIRECRCGVVECSYLRQACDVLSSEGKLPLVELARVDTQQRVNMIDRLLQKGTLLTKTDAQGNTLLSQAFSCPNYVLPFVLGKIKKDQVNKELLSLGLLALLKQHSQKLAPHVNVIQDLLQIADPCVVDKEKSSLLHLGVLSDEHVLPYLLPRINEHAKKKEIMNLRDNLGQTALMILLKNRYNDIAKYSVTIEQLMDMGADPYIEDDQGTSLATLARGKPVLGWLESSIVAKKHAHELEQSTAKAENQEAHVEGAQK